LPRKKEDKNTLASPDFGTYHHTTSEMSEEIRNWAKTYFIKAFEDLPFSQDDKLKIVDVGCGLGFLSCICAEHYHNASVTGFDTFEDPSLKNSTLAKAMDNAKVLGFSQRIAFQKKDFFRSDYSRSKTDLFVSNLVFHNFGKKRLIAYQRLARWTGANSYVVLGDLFTDYKTVSDQLAGLFGGVEERPDSTGNFKILVLSKPRKLRTVSRKIEGFRRSAPR
jgi:cyclopropane fatty-acyl-phospholipid synthase-like methyltransferase